MVSKSLLRLLLWMVCISFLQSTTCGMDWELGPTGSKASFRAISAPSNQTIWIGGSQGTILRSKDGGNSWQNVSPSGYPTVEFRSLHAWDEQRACAASAGTPAVILLTEDGGTSWNVQYQNDAPEAFFDGLQFWDDNQGIAISDPVAGDWLIVESSDAGKSWRVTTPALPAANKEAAFAASNSAMIASSGGAVWLGTGGIEGATSRIHHRSAAGEAWMTSACPLPSNASSGVFSIANSLRMMVAVGGDYRPDATSKLTAAWSSDGGDTWQPADEPPSAFRSAVVAIRNGKAVDEGMKTTFIATGPSGSDYSMDGRTWSQFSETGFHALTQTATEVFAVGSEGRFARLKLEP